jgi:hypothetical protein
MSESIFDLIQQHNATQTGGRQLVPEKVATYLASDEEVQRRPNAIKPRGRESLGGPGGRTHPAPQNKGTNGMPTMKEFERAKAAARAAAETATRQRKQITKPPVNSQRPRELDPCEVARRRQMTQMSGMAVAHALGGRQPERRPPRSAANRNVTQVREQSIINGLMKEQGGEPLARQPEKRSEFTGKARQPLAEGQVDRVEQNKLDVEVHAARRAKKEAPAPKFQPRARPAGQIPRYLVERKIEMEVSKQMAADEALRAAGPAPLPEQERLSTLAALKEEKERCVAELVRIPPSKLELGTYARQAKKLEERLKQIDGAIETFSKRVVYVQ